MACHLNVTTTLIPSVCLSLLTKKCGVGQQNGGSKEGKGRLRHRSPHCQGLVCSCFAGTNEVELEPTLEDRGDQRTLYLKALFMVVLTEDNADDSSPLDSMPNPDTYQTVRRNGVTLSMPRQAGH